MSNSSDSHKQADNKIEIVRDHDKLYLSEDRKNQPKEYFKFIVSIAKEHLDKYTDLNVLDIGCATGDFLYYLKSLYPFANLTGMDVMPELLQRAKLEVRGCDFILGNICDAAHLPTNKYDAVFMNGVHSIFDDIDSWLNNSMSLVNKANNGKLFIFGIFNPYNIDVLVKVRNSDHYPDGSWQPGWNCFSIETIKQYLEKSGVKSYCFHQFEISIDIPKNAADPLRSWTFVYNNGKRGIMNGSMLVHNFMLLEISF